jgi:hypothetical protein
MRKLFENISAYGLWFGEFQMDLSALYKWDEKLFQPTLRYFRRSAGSSIPANTPLRESFGNEFGFHPLIFLALRTSIVPVKWTSMYFPDLTSFGSAVWIMAFSWEMELQFSFI